MQVGDNIRESTLTLYDRSARTHIIPTIGHKRLSVLNGPALQKWVNSLMLDDENPRSARTGRDQ